MTIRHHQFAQLAEAQQVLGGLRQQLRQDGSWQRMWHIDDALAVLSVIEQEWREKSGYPQPTPISAYQPSIFEEQAEVA